MASQLWFTARLERMVGVFAVAEIDEDGDVR